MIVAALIVKTAAIRIAYRCSRREVNWRPRASASGPGVAADPAASSATSPPEKAAPAHQHGDEQQAVIAAMLLVVIVPLWVNSDRIDKTAVRRSEVQAVADRWANDAGWSVTGVTAACN